MQNIKLCKTAQVSYVVLSTRLDTFNAGLFVQEKYVSNLHGTVLFDNTSSDVCGTCKDVNNLCISRLGTAW